MKTEAFECGGCKVLQLPRAKHPEHREAWVGHCEKCHQHSEELYLDEGFGGRDVFVCFDCCEATSEPSYGGHW